VSSRSRWLGFCLLASVVIFGSLLRIALLRPAIARSPDEQVFTTQARMIASQGMQGDRYLVRTYLRRPELWLYPPPTRTGYLVLLAAVMKLTGVEDERAGAYLACGASIAALVIAAGIGWRFFGIPAAMIGLILLAVLPPDLMLARRCWQDSLIACWGLAMIGIVMEIDAAPSARRGYVGLALAGCGLALIKELSAVFTALCYCAAAAVAVRARAFKNLSALLGAALLGGIAAAAILAVFAGGFDPLLQVVLGLPRANANNEYALRYASGPGYLLPRALQLLAPMTLYFGIFGILTTLLRRELRTTPGPRSMAVVTLAFTGVFMLIPHGLNLRYLSPVYAPLCLFAGAGLWQLHLAARQRLRPVLRHGLTACAVLVIALSLLSDYTRFHTAFVKGGINDLSVGLILRATGHAW